MAAAAGTAQGHSSRAGSPLSPGDGRFGFRLSADSSPPLRHHIPPPLVSPRLSLPFNSKTHFGPQARLLGLIILTLETDSGIKSEVKHSTVLHLKIFSLCHFSVCHHEVLQCVQATEVGSECSHRHPSPVLPSPWPPSLTSAVCLHPSCYITQFCLLAPDLLMLDT